MLIYSLKNFNHYTTHYVERIVHMKSKFRFSKAIIAVLVVLNLLAYNIFAATTTEYSLFNEDQTLYSGKIVPSDAVDEAFSDEIEKMLCRCVKCSFAFILRHSFYTTMCSTTHRLHSNGTSDV